MHELAIAESIVRIASAHADGRPVVRVELRVGYLRQVVPSALRFSFGLVAEGTAVDGAELAIETVPTAGRCAKCGAEGPLGQIPLSCASCGSLEVSPTAGSELQVEALEVEEEVGVGA